MRSKIKHLVYFVAVVLVVAGIFVAYNYREIRPELKAPIELVKQNRKEVKRVEVVTIKKPVKVVKKLHPTTAVVDFTVDPSVKVNLTGSSIAVKLEQALGNKYHLVTRSQVSKAMEELRFQSSDLVNRSKAKKFGHMLGADYLITGSVVQIGKEITLACQRFNIETGAIKQTAEVSAVNVNDFNYMIREAAMILGMSASDKQQYMDKKINYPKYLKAGKKAFAANNFGEAVQYFKLAQAIKQTQKVSILLKTAEAKAEEQRIQNEYTVKYHEAMRQGRKLLREHKLNEADAVFKEALNIPGYKYNKSLLSGLKVISNREYVINFDKFMDREKTIIIYVPGDVKTIQTAMNMANAGDTIYLEPGDYRETIVFKEGVILRGHDKKRCRILPVSTTAAVIIALDCRSGSIQNLTIDGSSQDSDKEYGLGLKTKTVNGKYIVVEAKADIPKGAELLTVNGSPYPFFPYLIALQGKDKKVTLKYRLNGSTVRTVFMKSYKTGEAGIFPDGIAVLNSTIEVEDCIISNLKGSGIYASGHRSGKSPER